MMTSLKKPSLFIGLLFLAPLFNTPAFADSGLSIEHAWVAEAPPMSKVMAGYMKVKNDSNTTVNIISATSPSFERIEFHQTQYKNDLAQMRKLEQLSIAANAELKLEAGSIHMMLFKPSKRLKAGDKVSYIFNLDNGKSISAIASVKKLSNKHSQHSHQHH